MEEIWQKWEPIKGLSEKYYIEQIIDSNKEGFIINLNNDIEKNNVKIIFPNSVLAYRHTVETLSLETYNYLDKKYGKDFFIYWSFFKVIDSEFLRWLSFQSLTISDDYSLMHFSLLTFNSKLDIAASYEPKVELINISEAK